ncbi:MAG: Bifunctional uridylyltransferase/uridylyl-removing enzyme [Candidatus Tokpelaia hoelldobleri]|uniref:Bifunctional uridylyltransferase/uridylyl-removing enzyme n=1 Tax=Candidatus Tokpelaia hoelldobleri TaxID=1902579 RepID=A0A1U9JTH4_9HYPH|nr:MAG: Bifunctional uridylyltransferase/uridylyl-removing enzyme [Candidatus Tokpelaia hoelldoblerii]
MTAATKPDTMFDAAVLAQLACKIPAGKPAQLRAAVTARVKEQIRQERKHCEALLLAENKGRSCAQRLCRMTDAIISTLYEFVTGHIYPPGNPSQAEHITLVAVGGYGHGTLAPYSDIDLMFLLPWKRTPWCEQVMEYMLYLLWDCGLKVGHSTRNVSEAIRMGQQDITVRTALLEARYLTGGKALFDDLASRFATEVVAGSAPEFIRAKLAERDARLKKAGETRYLVEPDVKESKGGLRDLQTLVWIARYHYRITAPDQLVQHGVLSRQEAHLFQKAADFLWTVRCHLHFVTARAQDKLSFDLQREIAHRLGYTDHPGLEDVERFMKHYFLTARQVGNLTRIICAALEDRQAKTVSGLDRTAPPRTRETGKIPDSADFIVENHRLTLSNDQIFTRDPVNLIRIFHLADTYRLALHPHAMQQLSRSLRLVNTALRENKIANALFVDIVTSPRNPALVLRRMNESGILGKFIPDFGKIVAMTQFNMYHHYTVDEHLLRCIDHLSRIEKGQTDKEHPLAHSLLDLIHRKRRILYPALFLHDIAKGRAEHHAPAGEKIARKLCPRFGLDREETDTIAWLVREHLTMNMVAQSRDLNDHKTIADFAGVVQTVERLQLLLVLTICDIKGVGPDVWNGWKGQLLRTLYHKTRHMLTNGASDMPRAARVNAAKAALAARLPDWDRKTLEHCLALHYSPYWLAVAPQNQLRHARFILEADRQGKALSILVRPLAFEAVTELTILAPDHPRLLSIITGSCASAGANIVDAQIFTTTDGRGLDRILISRAFAHDADEERRARNVGRMIENALSGKIRLPDMIAAQPARKDLRHAFDRPPRVDINNNFSNKFSVLEIKGLDRPGLLSELTRVIADMALDIASAHINTFGEKVIDTFYVTDLVGHKITDLQRQRTIKRRLLAVFAPVQKENHEPD